MGGNDRDIGHIEGLLEALSEDVKGLKDMIGTLQREGCNRAGEHSAGILRAHERIDKIEGLTRKIVFSVISIMAISEGGRSLLMAMFSGGGQ